MRTMILWLTLLALILSSCAPAPTTTPAPSATPVPTATATRTPAPTTTPMVTPTATATPIPTIQVGDLTFPDPRFTNPELFDLSKPDAPIPQFVNAMKMAEIEVKVKEVAETLAQPTNFQSHRDVNSDPYITSSYTLTDTKGNFYTISLMWDERLGWRETTLKDWGEKKGIQMGVYIEPNASFWDNPFIYQEIVKKHFDTLVVPYFWHVVFQNRSKPDFGLTDTYLRISKKNGMLPFPAAFVWQNPNFLPHWVVNEHFERKDFVRLIENTVNHIPLSAQVIPVVNEPYVGDFLSQRIGGDYIPLAFSTVRQLRPKAFLIMNHFSILKGQDNFAYTVQVMKELKQQSLVDGIGIQLHIGEGEPPSYDLLTQSLDYWKEMAGCVYLTEISVNYGDPITRARVYYTIIRAAVDANVEAIHFWGIGPAAWEGADSTPFDKELNPNLSFFAIQSAFAGIR